MWTRNATRGNADLVDRGQGRCLRQCACHLLHRRTSLYIPAGQNCCRIRCMKTPWIACFLSIGIALAGSELGNSTAFETAGPFETAGSVERADPGLDAIVPAGAKIEKLADDCKWTEGPIWIHSGFLLFADIPHNRILKWTPAGSLTVFMQPSGY